MILWAIIRNITWVVWLHLRSAHGLYLLWSWMYLLGSSYFACTVMVCFTHDQLWGASHWYRTDFLGKWWSQGRPSRLFPGVVLWWASPTGERLPPGESLQVLLSVAWRTDPAKKFTQGRAISSSTKDRSLACGTSPPWRVHFTVAKKKSVMESWLLPWSSLADVSSWALAAGTSC